MDEGSLIIYLIDVSEQEWMDEVNLSIYLIDVSEWEWMDEGSFVFTSSISSLA